MGRGLDLRLCYSTRFEAAFLISRLGPDWLGDEQVRAGSSRFEKVSIGTEHKVPVLELPSHKLPTGPNSPLERRAPCSCDTFFGLYPDTAQRHQCLAAKPTLR